MPEYITTKSIPLNFKYFTHDVFLKNHVAFIKASKSDLYF